MREPNAGSIENLVHDLSAEAACSMGNSTRAI